jgi:hypothetical protein
MLFADLEPFGWKANLHGHALTSAVMSNIWLKKSDGNPFVPADFIPGETGQERAAMARKPASSKSIFASLKAILQPTRIKK